MSITVELPTTEVLGTTGNSIPDILDMFIQRDKDGVVLSLKSEEFERFFKTTSPYSEVYLKEEKIPDSHLIKPAKMFPESGKQLRLYKTTTLKTNRIPMVFDHNSGLLYNEDVPNLVVLSAVGLGEGVNVHFRDLYTESQLKRFGELFKEAAIELHRQYIKKFSLQYTISAKEVF